MVVSFDQNARKFCFETEWIGSVKLEKFWKINSTFQGESFVLVRPVRWNLFRSIWPLMHFKPKPLCCTHKATQPIKITSALVRIAYSFHVNYRTAFSPMHREYRLIGDERRENIAPLLSLELHRKLSLFFPLRKGTFKQPRFAHLVM